MVSDYHLRATWRAFDRPVYGIVTWTDIEYCYTRSANYPLLKTGIDFADEEWMRYDRE